MAHILYSAEDADGKPVQGFVEAPSADEARRTLRARGLKGVVLHQEASIATDAREIAALDERQQQELAKLRLEVSRRPGLAGVLQALADRHAKWFGITAAMAIAGWWTGKASMLYGGIGLFAVPLAFTAWMYRHGGRYNQLLKAFSLGDWQRVAQLARKLRGLRINTGQLDFDLDVRLAYIEAKHGRMAQALAALEPWRAKLQDSPGLFEARVASVYTGGEDRAGYIRMMAEAVERSRGEPARKLDLALAHARFGDAAAAAELMKSIDIDLLPPHGRHFVGWTEGLLELRAGDALRASATLGGAMAGFLKMSNTPAVWSALAFCTCDHAIALSNAGRKDEARRELAHVWPIVRPHADRAFLRMLQADGLAPT